MSMPDEEGAANTRLGGAPISGPLLWPRVSVARAPVCSFVGAFEGNTPADPFWSELWAHGAQVFHWTACLATAEGRQAARLDCPAPVSAQSEHKGYARSIFFLPVHAAIGVG